MRKTTRRKMKRGFHVGVLKVESAHRFLIRVFLNLAAIGALISVPGAPVRAFEDDGRPYAEIAKRVGPVGEFSVPLTAMNYHVWGVTKIHEYLDAMDAKSDATGGRERQANPQCQAFHDRTTRDGVLEVHYALGYFDDSTGHPIVYSGLDWGKSASDDEGMWIAIRHVLTEPCPRDERRLCGFTEKTSEADRQRYPETLLVRRMEIQGQSVEVRLKLTYASASPFYERNKTELRSKQERFTRTSEENFFGGIRTADYAFYMGHSRNGGGPDFNPPRLNAMGKPNYDGYYRKVYPGRTRLLDELKKAKNTNLTIGLFSCDSDLHFRRKLEVLNKNQSSILTVGSVGRLTYYDTLQLSFGYLEGLLRGSCGTQLDEFARVTGFQKSTFRSYNMK